MKSFIKNNLKVFVTMIITTIIVGSVSVYAASQYFAKDITFTPTNENFKKENGEAITNVEDALNELYNQKNNGNLQYSFCTHTWNSNQKGGANIQFSDFNYKKFKIISFNSLAGSTATYYLADKDYSPLATSLNEEYLLDSDIRYLYITEQTSQSYGYACATVEFYN